jgi:hypothetical protein
VLCKLGAVAFRWLRLQRAADERLEETRECAVGALTCAEEAVMEVDGALGLF